MTIAPELPDAVVFDIDGVLCANVERQREQIAAGAPVGVSHPDWEQFSKGYPDDGSNQEYVALTQLLAPAVRIVLLTCRQECHREVTRRWLREHHVAYDELIMWDPEVHDYYEHKRVAIDQLMRRFSVRLVLEDSQTHARMYAERGLRVILVPDGLAH